MTLYTPTVLKWLQDNMSCRRFARHVATGEELVGGPYRWFHFWLHWAVCPFCRRYWREIKQIGEAQRALSRGLDATQMDEVEKRITTRLKGKFLR